MKKIPSWQKDLSGYGMVVQDDNLELKGHKTKSIFIFDIQKSLRTFYDSMLTVDHEDMIDVPWEHLDGDEYCIFSSLYGGGVSMISFRRANGVIHGGEYAGDKTGPCYKGLEIKRIASSPNYRGMSWPLRYTVLAKANEMGTGIFADRESLSDDASNQYRTKFGKFAKKPFDDIYNPKTLTKEDDCVLYSSVYPNMKAVDYLYSFDAGMPKYYATMRANYSKFCKMLSVKPPPQERKGLWEWMSDREWNETTIRDHIQKQCEYIAELIFDENYNE